MQQYQDLLIDALLDQGFSLEEAEQLIALQDRLEREDRETQLRQEFVRWLIDNHKLGEYL